MCMQNFYKLNKYREINEKVKIHRKYRERPFFVYIWLFAIFGPVNIKAFTKNKDGEK